MCRTPGFSAVHFANPYYHITESPASCFWQPTGHVVPIEKSPEGMARAVWVFALRTPAPRAAAQPGAAETRFVPFVRPAGPAAAFSRRGNSPTQ